MFGKKAIPPERRQAELRRMETQGRAARRQLAALHKLEQELRFQAGLTSGQIDSIRPEFYATLAAKVMGPAAQANHELHQVLLTLDNLIPFLPGGRS